MEVGLKIYLISLEEDVERRTKLLNNFPVNYKKMEWVKAVNGKKLNAKDYFSYVQEYFSSHQKVITPGEIGCTLSHIKALEAFLSTEEHFCLILEDDVQGQDKDIEKLTVFFSNTNLRGVFLLRDQNNFGYEKYIFGKKRSDFYEIPKFSIKFMFGACSYIVDRESARAILSHHDLNFEIADLWYKILDNSKTNFYYSPIFIHPKDLSDSNIEDERANFYINEKNFFKRVYKQGVFWKISNRINNDFCSFILFFKGYKHIHRDGTK